MTNNVMPTAYVQEEGTRSGTLFDPLASLATEDAETTSTGTTTTTTAPIVEETQTTIPPTTEGVAPTVTPITTPEENLFEPAPEPAEEEMSDYYQAWSGLNYVSEQVNELNNPSDSIVESGSFEELRKELGWSTDWKATEINGELVPLKAAQDITGSTEAVTNTKDQAWHTYGLANRSTWSSEGYTNPYEILNDPNSNIDKVRWIGDNSKIQKQESKDYTVNTQGAETDYQFKDYMDEIFLVHDKKVGWRTVKGSQLLNPHHEAATPYTDVVETPEDPLTSFFQQQVSNPAIPASGQQTYQEIITRPEDFLTDNEKKVATELNISLTEAAKSKIIATSTGAYENINVDNIEELKNLTASTYSDNISTISDEAADKAKAEAQLISSLDTVYSNLETGITAAEGEITQDAEAAQRDTLAEQAAMAETQDAVAVDQITAATGEAEQVEGIPGAVDSVTRQVDTITGDITAEGPETINVGEVGTPEELATAKAKAEQAGKSVAEITDPITGVTRLVDTITNELIAQGPSRINVGEVEDVDDLQTATTTAETATAVENTIDTNVADVEKQVSTIDTEIAGEAAQVSEEKITNILEGTTAESYTATTGSITAGTAAKISGSEKVGNAVRDVAQGEAAVDDLDDPQVIAAIAELPTEALVSTQLETLLDPLENDEIPVWARPAVDKVDAMLAARGMGRSSIARDALFNAIITAATPIAQGNAVAIQERAKHNLANQQSANELQVKMTQDIRLANLSNEQSMEVENLRALNASQSEQFNFDAQQKLKEYDTLINFKIQNAQFAQQMETSNLSSDLQLELANLNHMNTADAANMTAENQLRLGELKTYVDFVSKNTEYLQQMELANLDMEGKVEFANLQSKQQADIASMTFEEKKALTEYQTQVSNGQFNQQLAQALNFKNLDVKTNVALANMQAKNESYRATFTTEQQEAVMEWQATVEADKFFEQLSQNTALANLDMEGKIEFANLSALNAAAHDQMTIDQQTALAEYQSKIDVAQFNTQLAQALNFKNLDVTTNVELANMQAQNESYRNSFSAEQQRLLSEFAATAEADKLFATLGQDIKLANLDMEGKVEFANLAALNEANRDQMTVDQQKALTEYETKVNIGKYNAELAQQMGIANLSNKQQAAVQNSMNNLNMDLRKLELDQQIELANSQFLQTMTATDLSNRQQASILNATNMAAMDMANLTNQQQAQVENARNFLQLDLTNLSNAQQAELFNDQWDQQVLLSNQAVENAARQFASTAENDINKFIASMSTSIEQTNAAQNAAMSQFNATEENKTTALNQQNDQAVEVFNAQLRESIVQFQEQVEFQRESFNASMEYQIDTSNVQWRRNMNTANTAGVNAVNQANAINAFNLSSDAMNKLWQEVRDQATWEFQSSETEKAAKAQMALSVLGNEHAEALTRLKIDADDETAMGEGLANLFGGILSGDYSLSNVTGFFD